MMTVSPVNMYKEWFEIPFLENTKRFYQMVANQDLNESLIDYVMKVSIDKELIRIMEMNICIWRLLDIWTKKNFEFIPIFNCHHPNHTWQWSKKLSFKTTGATFVMKSEPCWTEQTTKVHEEILIKQFSKKFPIEFLGLKRLFKPMRQLSMLKPKLKPIIKDYIYQTGYQFIEEMSTDAKIVWDSLITSLIDCIQLSYRILNSLSKQSLKFMENSPDLSKISFWMIRFLLMLAIRCVFLIQRSRLFWIGGRNSNFGKKSNMFSIFGGSRSPTYSSLLSHLFSTKGFC